MKRFAILTIGFISAVSTFHAQEGEPEEEEGVTLPEYIGSIAEKEQPTATDYFHMANGTLQVAQAVSHSGGKALPKPVIEDALDAIAAGRELEPDGADWDKIEQQLLKLLDPPKSDQQQQQGQDGEQNEESQDQNQQNSDSQNGQNSQENSESGQQQQDQESSQQQSQENQGDSQDQQQESQDQGQSSAEQDSGGQEGELPQAQDGAQMGELQEQESQDVQLADESEQQPPPPQEQMQTLGGQQTTGEPIDAENAAIRQMLQQLRQQDDPGKLFKILQDAQEGGKQNSAPNTKDW